jgi:hypothetical protein
MQEPMASRKEARQAVAEDLRVLADDLKAFVEDPRKRARKERRWRALYGGLALVFTLVGRRAAARAWSILTGEVPPTKAAQTPTESREREPVAGRH